MKTLSHVSGLRQVRQYFQSGYTLLELMISTALGVIIMAGVVQMYASSRTAENTVIGTARVQENVRYVFNRLEQDIGRAGLTGCLPLWHTIPGKQDGDPRKIVSMLGLDSGPGKPYDYFQPYAGLDGGTGSGPGFTDELSVRYMSPVGAPILNDPLNGMPRIQSTLDTIFVDPNHPLYKTFKQWQIAILADCDKALIFMITNDPQSAGNLGEIKMAPGVAAPTSSNNKGQFNTSCEFLGPGSAACRTLGPKPDPSLPDDTAGFSAAERGVIEIGAQIQRPLPAMVFSAINAGTRVYKVEDSEAGKALGKTCSSATPQYCALTVNGEELVDGVEDFQVQFGEQRGGASNTLAFLDSGDVVNWPNVRSVRISITLNSVDKAGMSTSSGLSKKTFTRTFNIYNACNPSTSDLC